MSKRLEQGSNKDKDILLHGYQVARGWSGLIVSLSTGIIVFTATFRRYMVPEGQPVEAMNFLKASWAMLGIAILFGIVYLSTLIPQLNKG